MRKSTVISIFATLASFPTIASAFVLHLEHGFGTHNPVVTLGGMQPSSALPVEIDVSLKRGDILSKTLSSQQRYSMRLVNRGSVSVKLRLDIQDAGGIGALPGTQPIDLVLEPGEARELAMEAWTPMMVVVSTAAP